MSPFERAWNLAKKSRIEEILERRGSEPEGMAPDIDPLEGAERSLGSDVLEGHRFSHMSEDTSERDSAHWLDRAFHSRSYEPNFHDDDDVYEQEAARYEDRERKKAMRRGMRDPRESAGEEPQPPLMPSWPPKSPRTYLQDRPRTFKEILAARSKERRG
jgi:hypothetical protein